MFTEDEQKEGTASAEEGQKDQNQEEQQQQQDSQGSTENKEDADYWKGIADEEKKRRENAESSAQYHREQAENLRKEQRGQGGERKEEDFKEDEGEKPLTAADIERIATNAATRAAQGTESRTIAREISGSAQEAEAILEAWKGGRVAPTGDLREDLLNVQAVLYRKRNAAMRTEVERAENHQNFQGSGMGAGQKPGGSFTEPTVSQEDRNHLTAIGATWNAKEGVWKAPTGETFKNVGGKIARV